MTTVLAWLMAHETLLATIVVAVVDFIFSVNPNAESNTFLEWLLTEAKSLVNSIPKAGLKKPKV